MTGDHRFEEVFRSEDTQEGGDHDMCEVLDRIEQRGISIGKQEGAETERLSNIRNLMDTLALSAQEAMIKDILVPDPVVVSIWPAVVRGHRGRHRWRRQSPAPD